MANSGDPSTFTFTMDAFPGYLKWDKSKKVLAAVQIVDEDTTSSADTLTFKAQGAIDYASETSGDEKSDMVVLKGADDSNASSSGRVYKTILNKD